MPSKSKEKLLELRKRIESKRIEWAEDLRQRTPTIAEEPIALGAESVQRLCWLSMPNINKLLKNCLCSVGIILGLRCYRTTVDIHPKAYVKIISTTLSIIGILRFLNNISNGYVDNTKCPTLFPLNWICSKMVGTQQIVY